MLGYSGHNSVTRNVQRRFFPAEPAPLADAMEQGGESWTLLSNLAKKHKVNIVGGSVARLGPEGQVFNTMYIFDRQGQEVATYDKIHLFFLLLVKRSL